MERETEKLYDKLQADIDAVNKISIVPAMLDIICQTTGMGFAAVARVTEDRWIACTVLDHLQFGLVSGGELQIKTTLCDTIRSRKQAIVIDHVAEDPIYFDHHTPKTYGLQSYISVPIVLKSGEFFGTLCAIDPKPAQLKNDRVIGMFNMFAELIAFHLQSLDLIERSNQALQEFNKELSFTQDENRQYSHISNHNLQEPLRQIRMFSDILVNAVEERDVDSSKRIAAKINVSAQKLSMMIKDLSDFSELSEATNRSEWFELNKVVNDVRLQLDEELVSKNVLLTLGSLPRIHGLPVQMEQLFFHLIKNALKFYNKAVQPVIKISSLPLTPAEAKVKFPANEKLKYVEISVEDNGIGMEKKSLEKIFDIFSKLSQDEADETFGIGLAYCRKIVHIHGGHMSATSVPGEGTTFSIILPISV